MKMLDVIRLAFRALTRNSMRTLLTMLGMIIGVAAVITMLALGNGAKASVQSSIQSLGTNTLMISSGSSNRGGVRSGAFSSETLTVEEIMRVLPWQPWLPSLKTVLNWCISTTTGFPASPAPARH